MSKPSRRASRVAERTAGRPQPGSSGSGSAARPPSTRAGRRERPRTGFARRSFLDRYRGPLLTLAGVAAIALVAGFVFVGATAKTYACAQIWNPAPTASPAPGASGNLGYVQPDMGNSHNVGTTQRYTYCPPASGTHNGLPPAGPIQARLYGPDDFTQPQGWIHNLEHGAIVILYKCPGEACDEAGQQKLRQFYQAFPNSPVCNTPPGALSPVIARFDDMAWPYAALVWDRVLPLQTLDTAAILEFYRTFGERTNLEKQCQAPSPSAAPSGSVAPSGSTAPSGSATPSGSAAGSASPSGSTAPSPAAS